MLPDAISAPPPEPSRPDRAPLSTLPEAPCDKAISELYDPIEFTAPESSSRTPVHGIPLALVSQRDTDAGPPSAFDIHGMHLIVVEDEPRLAAEMVRQLRARGAVVAVARKDEHGAGSSAVPPESADLGARSARRGALSRGQRVHPRLTAAMAGLALLGLVAVAAFGLAGRGTSVRSAAAPRTETRPAPTLPPAPPPSLATRAELGDEAALAELESRTQSERSVEEVFALTRGNDFLKRRSIVELGEHIALEPSIGAEPSTLRKLKLAASDPIVYTEAIEVMASLPGATAGDLLYDVWLRTSKRQPANELAKRLLHADAVRKNVSPALRVALELRAVDRCDRLVALLPRIEESGDRRALPLIVGLPHRTCSPASAKNCYYCVQGKPGLRRAILAASRRPAPAFN